MRSAFIILNTFQRGGAEMSLAVLANELASKGVRVTLIALWRGENSYNFDWVSESGGAVLELNGSKSFISVCVKLIKKLVVERPDVVYSAMLYANVVSLICCRLSNIHHIASVRINPATYYRNNLVKRLSFAFIMWIQSDIVFISHKAMSDYLSTRYGRLIHRDRVFVLHNPILTGEKIDSFKLINKISQTKEKLDYFFDKPIYVQDFPKPIILLIVSRLVEGKGVIEILEQLSNTLRENRLLLLVFGTGPLELRIRDYIKRESLDEKIHLKGFGDDIDKIFSESDILLFPSRSEGFGRVPFEGLLRGNLVLCNELASIIREFPVTLTAWKDYSEPLDLMDYFKEFRKIDPVAQVEEISKLAVALDPKRHAFEFEKIVSASRRGLP